MRQQLGIAPVNPADALRLEDASGSSSGNPTASVGLAAINGVATTYMRSDAAPALNIAIAPSWTGFHNFNGGAAFSQNIGGASLPLVTSANAGSIAWNKTNGNGEVDFFNNYWTALVSFNWYQQTAANAATLVMQLQPTGLTVPGNVVVGGTLTGTATLSALAVSSAVGATYGGQWQMTNSSSGAANPTKTFRVNPSGGLEIINNAFTQAIFSLSDAGALNLNAVAFNGGSGSTINATPHNYGSLLMTGNQGGYAGIQFFGGFGAQGRTLMVNGTSALQGFYDSNAGAWDWYIAAGAIFNVSACGGAWAASGAVSGTTLNATSDVSKKHNVQPITDAQHILAALNGVRFDWNEDDTPSAGLIAQEVERVMPELVTTNTHGTKQLNYNGIVAVLVEEVKALRAQVHALAA
jgi:hypothetical protein